MCQQTLLSLLQHAYHSPPKIETLDSPRKLIDALGVYPSRTPSPVVTSEPYEGMSSQLYARQEIEEVVEPQHNYDEHTPLYCG